MNIPFKRQKSHYPGELVVLAQNYANLHLSSEHVLIVVGGDGSFNEVLNGIKTSNYPETAITYLPAGTGNDFARGAGLTADPRQLINNLLRDPEPEQVDCGFFTSN
ncbi:MAG: acylglycerol kinase family protein, partial [Lactobacillus crispatus]|nr:acylglycerol kinase family protein [Lactobacillus crispatus]